ncbi:integrase [Sesbania bispinosa]|nr:integrase [Sesbania bispinosa]
MLTRAKAKAMAAEARRKRVIVTEEPKDPSIPKLELRRRRSFGSERWLSKSQQLMADRLLKRNIAATTKKAKNVGETFGKDSENIKEPKAKRPKVDTVPEGKFSLKNKASASNAASTDDKGKGKKLFGSGLPTSEMLDEEVRHHLAVQGRRVFGQKSEEEMTDYLNAMSEWCMGGTMLTQYFVGAIKDLAALPKLKKSFHEGLAEYKRHRPHPSKQNTYLLDEAKTTTDELELLREESAGVYFHAAIKQIKFLNLGVELKTQGMSTLCLIENGKWYRAQPEGNVEYEPGDEELASPVLQADAEEDWGAEEEGLADEEKVDPQAGGE